MMSTNPQLSQANPTVSDSPTHTFRVILTNINGQICITRNTTESPYDLPCFRIEPDESIDNDTERHMIEELVQREVGYQCSIQARIVTPTELKEDERFCYRISTTSEARNPFASSDIQWTSSIDDALQILSSHQSIHVSANASLQLSEHFLRSAMLAPMATPLASLDPNARPTTIEGILNEAEKPVPSFAQESQQHRYLHSKVIAQQRSGKQAGTYVSPSDDILSPASAKLNAVKERRFGSRSAKPRTLFASSRLSET